VKLLAFARFGLVALALSSVACSAELQDTTADGEDPLLRKTAATSNWSYRGPMPELESARMTVSLAGNTVHVSGVLPADYKGQLPFHAITEPAPSQPGRTLVHVVYPIATANPSGTTVEGLPVRNPEPADYEVCGGDNFRATNAIGSFAGFPFIEYVCNHRDRDGRVRSGIAFHGPITSEYRENGEYWYLKRGPVSHACNRMLGEHVLELAHLIGFDRGVRKTPVKVIADFDTFRGRKIDVEYAASGWTRPKSSEAFVFPMWQALKVRPDGTTALEFPEWACETSRCAAMPKNVQDAETGGLPRGEVACPPAYHSEQVGRGQLCIADDGQNAWGPYTAAMVEKCRQASGGAVCDTDRWEAGFAKRLRGDGACPIGARFDAVTGYCAEGESAFGPFPQPLVARCLGAGGGEVTCRSARWNRFFLARLLGRL